MGIRRDKGRLHLVSSGQSVGEGRPSRAADAGKLAHRPNLDGEEGAIAALVLTLADPALCAEDDAGRARAMQAVRAARKRVRRVLGEAEARVVFALAQVCRRDLAAVAQAHAAARPRLIAAAVESIVTMREHRIASSSARTSVAVAKRMSALGGALLDVGAIQLDPKLLSAAAGLIAAGRLELLNALEVERRCKIDRPDPVVAERLAAGLARLEASRAAAVPYDDSDPDDEQTPPSNPNLKETP